MTDDVDAMLDEYFKNQEISLAELELHSKNSSICYSVKNFNTKLNLLVHLLRTQG